MSIKVTLTCLATTGSILGSSCLIQAAGTAKSTLETIIVTAQKQEEDVQETPVPISVFNETALEDANVNNVDDAVDFIPNMVLNSSFSASYNQVNFRGLGVSKFTGKNPVVIFYDGIAQDNYSDYGLDLMNIERIEVLRGSQGTLYGKNAIGGVINMISKKPDNEFDSRLFVEAAEYDTYRVKSYVNGPIVKDKLFFGLSESYLQTDGYMKNDYPGEGNFDDDESLSVNSRLRWIVSDRLEVNLHAGISQTDAGSGTLINAAKGVKYHEYMNPNDSFDSDTYRSALNVGYDDDWANFTSITTYTYYDEETKYDNAFMGEGRGDARADYVYDSFSQELRIQSPERASGVKWLGGLYYSLENTSWDDNAFIYDTKSMLGYKIAYNWPDELKIATSAAFGQVTFPLLPKLNFTAGLRYEVTNKEMDYRYELTRTDTGGILVSDPFSPGSPTSVRYNIEDDWSVLLPKAILSYTVNDGAMIYASVGKGYLAGGFNFCEHVKEQATFNEQTSIDYELGIKSSWFDDLLLVNANIFYMDIENMHVYYAPDGWTYLTSNAGAASSQGIEIEATARPFKGLEIMAAYGLVQAEFDDYTNTQGIDCAGKNMPEAPDYTLNLTAQYRTDFGMFYRVGMRAYGQSYFDDANTYGQNAYQLYNAKIGYEAENWEVYVYGNNLSDEEYFSFGLVDATGVKGSVGAPQTFGLTFSTRF